MMFDVDEFVASCRTAVAGDEPLHAIKDVLERALREPERVAAALPPVRAEIDPLHVSPELTVLKVVWAPGMSFPAHNHLMWAAIGLYAGQEDNVFYRRAEQTLQQSGGRVISCGEVALLGPDVIHAVTNPLRSYAGAIHVYGGDLPHAAGRSEWEAPSFAEVPYDFERTMRFFAEANSAPTAAD
jgi:predicted metal-dependent enzyme (double-stranded beta helix superfamily)